MERNNIEVSISGKKIDIKGFNYKEEFPERIGIAKRIDELNFELSKSELDEIKKHMPTGVPEISAFEFYLKRKNRYYFRHGENKFSIEMSHKMPLIKGILYRIIFTQAQ